MKINNVKDIINYRNAYLRKLNERIYLLETKSHEKTDKKRIVAEANYITSKLDEISNMLHNLTDFDADEFAKFMSDFLAITTPNFKISTIIVNSSKRNKYKKYYVVADGFTTNFLNENITMEEQLTNLENDCDFTYFNANEKIFPFDENLVVSEEFSKYPRLKNAIYELIQLRLDNPSISDHDRYQKVLENTFYRNQKNYDKLLDKKAKKSSN